MAKKFNVVREDWGGDVRKFQVRGVLAGAYRGRGRRGSVVNLEGRTLRTHYYEVTNGPWGAGKTLCGRVKDESLSDLTEGEEASCPACLERFVRLVARAEGEKGPMVTVVGGES